MIWDNNILLTIWIGNSDEMITHNSSVLDYKRIHNRMKQLNSHFFYCWALNEIHKSWPLYFLIYHSYWILSMIEEMNTWHMKFDWNWCESCENGKWKIRAEILYFFLKKNDFYDVFKTWWIFFVEILNFLLRVFKLFIFFFV